MRQRVECFGEPATESLTPWSHWQESSQASSLLSRNELQMPTMIFFNPLCIQTQSSLAPTLGPVFILS